jgi:hypothetical protein
MSGPTLSTRRISSLCRPMPMGRAETRDRGDVVQLVDRAGYAHPVHGVTGAQVDDLQSAASLRLLRCQLVLEPEPRERAILARP